jgi:hypothetical protein
MNIEKRQIPILCYISNFWSKIGFGKTLNEYKKKKLKIFRNPYNPITILKSVKVKRNTTVLFIEPTNKFSLDGVFKFN